MLCYCCCFLNIYWKALCDFLSVKDALQINFIYLLLCSPWKHFPQAEPTQSWLSSFWSAYLTLIGKNKQKSCSVSALFADVFVGKSRKICSCLAGSLLLLSSSLQPFRGTWISLDLKPHIHLPLLFSAIYTSVVRCVNVFSSKQSSVWGKPPKFFQFIWFGWLVFTLISHWIT